MSSTLDLFSTYKYFGIICKYAGIGPYISKINNRYVQEIILCDRVKLTLLLAILNILNIRQLVTYHNTLDRTNSDILVVQFVYFSMNLIFVTFGIKNRKINYTIFCKMNDIFIETELLNTENGFKSLMKLTKSLFLVLLTCTLIVCAIYTTIQDDFLNSLNFLITAVIPVLLECQYICCLIIVAFLLTKLNKQVLSNERNLKLVQYYSYELFSLCRLVNNSFNHVLLRILVTFMMTVSSACGLLFEIIGNDCSYAMVSVGTFWIFTNNLGIFVVIFVCSSVQTEVSRTINKV